MSSAKWRLFCLGLNVLTGEIRGLCLVRSFQNKGSAGGKSRYWHHLNHTSSTVSFENAATILVILNGLENLPKIIDIEKNFKANHLTL